MESQPGSDEGRELLLPGDLVQFRYEFTPQTPPPVLLPLLALIRFLLRRHLTSSILGAWRQRDARLRALKLKWPLPPGQ